MASIERGDDDQIVKDAKLAINAIFGDKSVSVSETKERLTDIAGDIEIMLDALDEQEN